MNGVTPNLGLPATAIFQLAPHLPVKAPHRQEVGETLLAAVTHPPRIGQLRPLAQLLPDVLAQYGLTGTHSPAKDDPLAVDILA